MAKKSVAAKPRQVSDEEYQALMAKYAEQDARDMDLAVAAMKEGAEYAAAHPVEAERIVVGRWEKAREVVDGKAKRQTPAR